MSNFQFIAFIFEDVFWARPLNAPLMAVVFAAVFFLSLFLYRKAWGLSLRARILLCLLRFLSLALVLAIMFEPTGVIQESHSQARTLPVLVDVSESMSIKDPRKKEEDIFNAAVALGMLDEDDRTTASLNADQRQSVLGSSRLDLARGILTTSANPVFEELGSTLDISFHQFGSTKKVIDEASAISKEALESLKATDQDTAIANSLESVAKSATATPAGILLLTDGIDNSSSLRTESILQDLGARGISHSCWTRRTR